MPLRVRPAVLPSPRPQVFERERAEHKECIGISLLLQQLQHVNNACLAAHFPSCLQSCSFVVGSRGLGLLGEGVDAVQLVAGSVVAQAHHAELQRQPHVLRHHLSLEDPRGGMCHPGVLVDALGAWCSTAGSWGGVFGACQVVLQRILRSLRPRNQSMNGRPAHKARRPLFVGNPTRAERPETGAGGCPSSSCRRS